MSKKLTEFELIARIEALAAGPARHVTKSIGDDAAIIRPAPGCEVVWAVDAQVEDVHFSRRWAAPRQIGWRALAVNLSDLAAMGARPLGALVSIAIPNTWSDGDVIALHKGIAACAGAYECPLLGGNVSAAKGRRLQAHVSVLGEIARGKALRRDAARAGGLLWVTGRIGGGGLALDLLGSGESRHAVVRRYLRPKPPVAFAGELSRLGVRAAIDVSDGLLGDLGHVLEASGVGADLDLNQVPVPPALAKLRRAGKWKEFVTALNRGEDYQLLFAAHARLAPAIESAAKAAKVRVARIGVLTRKPGIRLLREGGDVLPYKGPGGWQHRH